MLECTATLCNFEGNSNFDSDSENRIVTIAMPEVGHFSDSDKFIIVIFIATLPMHAMFCSMQQNIALKVATVFSTNDVTLITEWI